MRKCHVYFTVANCYSILSYPSESAAKKADRRLSVMERFEFKDEVRYYSKSAMELMRYLSERKYEQKKAA